MKAIVMAGGEGTRLRPVTGGRPKPMVEILGKPVLSYTVDLLKKFNITDLCFTLRYLPGIIQNRYGDGSGLGVNITYNIESEPLGTAGSVAACGNFLNSDDFVVVSGDALWHFDLQKCVDFHKAKNADATILLYEHPEPTSYGVVVTADDGRIIRFVEKPAWETVMSGMVNTGIYVLSPRVLDIIPEGQAFDFGKDVFPKMLSDGMALYGFQADGYWCDVGTPDAYRRCCGDMLTGKTGFALDAEEIKPGVWSKGDIPASVTVIPPVYVGRGVYVEPGAELGPDSVLSEGSAVMRGARVAGSVLNGAVVKRDAVVTGAIIGSGATIGDGARVGTGCVVGDNALIGSGAVLSHRVKIGDGWQVANGSYVRKSLMDEYTDSRPLFDGDGVIKGEFTTDVTSENALALGGILGTLGRVAGASAGGDAARNILTAAGCGATGAGGTFHELDARFESEMSFCVREYAMSAGLFVRQTGTRVTMTFFEEGGVPASEALTRKLESAISGEYPKVSGPAVGGVVRVTGSDRVYCASLLARAAELGVSALGITVSVPGSGAENRTLRDLVKSLHGNAVKDAGNVPSFTVCQGGWGLSAKDESGEEIDPRHMTVVTAAALLRCGVTEIAADYTDPNALEHLAALNGGRILRLMRDGAEAEKRMKTRPWLRDGILSALAVMAAMSRDGVTLRGLAGDVPAFAEVTRRVDVACSRARAMELLADNCAEMAMELTCGLTVDFGRGRAHVHPRRDCDALEIRGEAGCRRDAEDICGEIEKKIAKTT